MYNWVTLLYSRNLHNTVNQLYFNEGLPRWHQCLRTCLQHRRHRDLGLISGSGRSPGGLRGNPLQYSCLENPMNKGALWARVHGVAKESDTTEWVTHICRRSEASSFTDGRSIPVHKWKGREITGTATRHREGAVQTLKMRECGKKIKLSIDLLQTISYCAGWFPCLDILRL